METIFSTPCVSDVMSHLSHVMCHVSHVFCHVSHVTDIYIYIKKSYKVLEIDSGGPVINLVYYHADLTLSQMVSLRVLSSRLAQNLLKKDS